MLGRIACGRDCLNIKSSSVFIGELAPVNARSRDASRSERTLTLALIVRFFDCVEQLPTFVVGAIAGACH